MGKYRSEKSIFGDHTNHYDEYGNKVGESRESIFGDHTNHYDKYGNKVGESRDSIFGDHTNHYDRYGNKTGESRESIFGDHTNHYDRYGNKTGETYDSILGNHKNTYTYNNNSYPYENSSYNNYNNYNNYGGYNNYSGYGGYGGGYARRYVPPKTALGKALTVISRIAYIALFVMIGLVFTAFLSGSFFTENIDTFINLSYVLAAIIFFCLPTIYGSIKFAITITVIDILIYAFPKSTILYDSLGHSATSAGKAWGNVGFMLLYLGISIAIGVVAGVIVKKVLTKK